MWATLELIPSKAQPIKDVEVHEVEVTGPIHQSFSEPGHPNQ
jgi:hypothetical protein